MAISALALALAIVACNTDDLDAGDKLKADTASVESPTREVASDGDPSWAGVTPSPARTVDFEASAGDHDGRPFIAGTLTGGALRYEGWRSQSGTGNYGFNWARIHAGSHVFVSASEVDNAGHRFMGAATYTVQNIVVKEGRVEFRLTIGWGSPLRVSTDILTVDP